MSERTYNVLFLCTGNTARSVLAEGILRKEGQGRFQAYSAGSFPKGTVNPLAFKVLASFDYPIDNMRSKSWEEFAAPGAPVMDFVFTVCDQAAGEACPIWPGQPMTAHWGIDDPAAVDGPDIIRDAAFVKAFRFLKNRITVFTSLLLASIVVGSGIMGETLTKDMALALLGNTIATGAMLVVLITIIGPISGAHFNRTVSLAFAIKGDLTRHDAVRYTAAQITGGIVGAIATHLMFAMPILTISEHVRTGNPQWFAEWVATFGLVVTILAGIRFAHAAVPWLVGLYITAAYWFTASTSFANPAVAIARSLTNTFSGIRPVDLPGFIAAQLAGALCALALVNWLLRAPSGVVTPINAEAQL